jgi:hypothetical protein
MRRSIGFELSPELGRHAEIERLQSAVGAPRRHVMNRRGGTFDGDKPRRRAACFSCFMPFVLSCNRSNTNFHKSATRRAISSISSVGFARMGLIESPSAVMAASVSLPPAASASTSRSRDSRRAIRSARQTTCALATLAVVRLDRLGRSLRELLDVVETLKKAWDRPAFRSGADCSDRIHRRDAWKEAELHGLAAPASLVASGFRIPSLRLTATSHERPRHK